ncbi:MAG TPA: ACP S-malonyltransferase [Vicinamibacterales bacterium]|nr:ACP S-malonyltransferase [Vicinamibacterales bacterium]
MLVRAARMHPAANDIVDRASVVLGPAMRRYFSAEGASLATNRDVQLATFLATQMHLAALTAEGLDSELSVGMSLGEYSHLVHIHALSFESALRLIDARGTAYDTAPPGMMAAVLAVGRDVVEEAVREASANGDIAISNYNSPSQHVIAGDAAAVTAAIANLEEHHLAHTIVTESRVPMHTALLRDVAEQFAAELGRAAWASPDRPYLPNVRGAWASAVAPADFVRCLSEHVTQPVRWQESVEMLFALHPGAVFVEVGPGRVLSNLFGRRWIRAACAATDAEHGSDAEVHFRAVADHLRKHS